MESMESQDCIDSEAASHHSRAGQTDRLDTNSPNSVCEEPAKTLTEEKVLDMSLYGLLTLAVLSMELLSYMGECSSCRQITRWCSIDKARPETADLELYLHCCCCIIYPTVIGIPITILLCSRNLWFRCTPGDGHGFDSLCSNVAARHLCRAGIVSHPLCSSKMIKS